MTPSPINDPLIISPGSCIRDHQRRSIIDHWNRREDLIDQVIKEVFGNCIKTLNRIGSVMVSELASSAVDRGFKPRPSQIKDYEIGSCCFSANHAALRRKCKDWLACNQGNVSEWGRLLFQWANAL